MSSVDSDIVNQAEFFKALSHPVRLIILRLVRIHPRHGEELASILSLNPATISHHINLMLNAGILTARKDQYYQIYSLNAPVFEPTLSEVVFEGRASLPEKVEQDAYRNKVLASFFQRGRLKSIPAQRKKRQIILEKIVESFEPDREYTEREINIILVEFHDDVVTLRRGLIEFGLMERQNGIYKQKTGISQDGIDSP
jgi:ArsR family transcriptional regulator